MISIRSVQLIVVSIFLASTLRKNMGFRFTFSSKINIVFNFIFTLLRILVIAFIFFYVIPFQLYIYFYLDFSIVAQNSNLYYDNKTINKSNTFNLVFCWLLWIVNIFVCSCTCLCSCLITMIIKFNPHDHLSRIIGLECSCSQLSKMIKQYIGGSSIEA